MNRIIRPFYIRYRPAITPGYPEAGYFQTETRSFLLLYNVSMQWFIMENKIYLAETVKMYLYWKIFWTRWINKPDIQWLTFRWDGHPACLYSFRLSKAKDRFSKDEGGCCHFCIDTYSLVSSLFVCSLICGGELFWHKSSGSDFMWHRSTVAKAFCGISPLWLKLFVA